MGKSKDLATLKDSGLSIDGTLTTTSTGTNLTSNSYNVVKIQTDKDDNGSNDDAILQFTTGSSNTVKGELRYDESESMFEIGHGDNQGHIRIDSSGRVTKPNNPWFSAHGTGGWVTFANAGSDNILNVFNGGTVYQNTGGGFNTSTSSYTAPVSGRYCFLYNTYTKGGASTKAGQYLYPRLYVNNTPTQPRENIKHYNGENYDEGREMTIMFNLAANDVVKCGCWSSHTTNQYYGASFHWQGFLVG